MHKILAEDTNVINLRNNVNHHVNLIGGGKAFKNVMKMAEYFAIQVWTYPEIHQ